MLTILNEALERERLVLSMGLCKNQKKRDIQEGRIQGLKLAISLLTIIVSC